MHPDKVPLAFGIKISHIITTKKIGVLKGWSFPHFSN